jgi:hypothetical protein
VTPQFFYASRIASEPQKMEEGDEFNDELPF